MLSAADLLRQARQRAESLRERPELRIEMLTLIAASLLNLEDFDAAENAATPGIDAKASRRWDRNTNKPCAPA